MRKQSLRLAGTALKQSTRFSLSLLRSALFGALVVGLFAPACSSSGAGNSEPGGNSGSAGAAVTAGSSGNTSSAGTGFGGAGSGSVASAGAGTAGSAAGMAGTGTGGAGTAGTGTAGAGMAGAGVGGSAGTGGRSTGASGAGAGGAAAFNPCSAPGAACTVMPLGDSITDGVGSSAPGGGYRLQLFHDAVQAHKALTFVGSATDPNGPAMLDGKAFPRDH